MSFNSVLGSSINDRYIEDVVRGSDTTIFSGDEASDVEAVPRAFSVSEPVNNEVIEKLTDALKLHEMGEIVKGKKTLTYAEREVLRALKSSLRVELLDKIRLDSLDAIVWDRCIEACLGKCSIKGSKDLGGHGGTFTAKITLDNHEDRYLFLKPMDETECRNYKMINKLSPEVSKFMPEIYGEIEKGKTRYLVMENVRLSATGASQEQLVDIKLAGKIEGNKKFNPIANQDEMMATRGRHKKHLDYMQMGKGAQSAPDYMVASGKLRLLNYQYSEKNLLESLEGIEVDFLKKLVLDLAIIQTSIISSPFAFIGASIILIKDQEGAVKPLLIDPAHVQVRGDHRSDVEEILPDVDKSRVFYGTDGEYDMQRTSNAKAISSLIESIDKLIRLKGS